MWYSTEPRFRKCIKGYGLLSFARKLGDKYGKKLMDTATKTGIDAAKTTSKRVVQKITEATGDLIGNKIAHKITSFGKPKGKGKKQSRRKSHSTRKKTTNYWWVEIVLSIKILLYKIANFLDTTLDHKELPKFVTKKWIEVYDQSLKKITAQTKKLELKRQC